MKKRLLCIMMTGIMLAFLCGCSKDEAQNTTTSTDAEVLVPTVEELPEDENAAMDETTETTEDSSAKVVEPLPFEIDINAIDDVMLWASFDMESIAECQDSYGAKVTLYAEDSYDAVDMQMLNVGDSIVVNGETMVVESKEDTNGIIINGGIEEGGAEFIGKDGGTYQFNGFDGYPTYTELGTADLYITPDCEIMDCSDLENPDGVKVEVKDLKSHFEQNPLTRLNTQVRIVDNKIVSINVRYIP